MFEIDDRMFERRLFKPCRVALLLNDIENALQIELLIRPRSKSQSCAGIVFFQKTPHIADIQPGNKVGRRDPQKNIFGSFRCQTKSRLLDEMRTQTISHLLGTIECCDVLWKDFFSEQAIELEHKSLYIIEHLFRTSIVLDAQLTAYKLRILLAVIGNDNLVDLICPYRMAVGNLDLLRNNHVDVGYELPGSQTRKIGSDCFLALLPSVPELWPNRHKHLHLIVDRALGLMASDIARFIELNLSRSSKMLFPCMIFIYERDETRQKERIQAVDYIVGMETSFKLVR